MPKGKKKITAEQFITTWNKASSAEQAAKTLQISVEFCRAKASSYRKRGVKNLRSHPTHGRVKLNIAKLSAIALKSAPKSGKHASA